MSNWYYRKKSTKKGPISFDSLSKMAENGEISRDTRVWKSGLSDWKPAGEVEGIFQSPPDVDIAEDDTEEENNSKSGMGALGCIGHLGSLFFFLWLSYQVGRSRMGPAGMIENPSAGWSWFVLAGIVGTIISFGVNLSRS